MMNNRISIGLLCLCALLLGGLLRSSIPTAFAQSATGDSTSQAGRYNIAAGPSNIYFTDTQTGRLWYYSTGLVVNEKGAPQKPAWREMLSPVTEANPKP